MEVCCVGSLTPIFEHRYILDVERIREGGAFHFSWWCWLASGCSIQQQPPMRACVLRVRSRLVYKYRGWTGYFLCRVPLSQHVPQGISHLMCDTRNCQHRYIPTNLHHSSFTHEQTKLSRVHRSTYTIRRERELNIRFLLPHRTTNCCSDPPLR